MSEPTPLCVTCGRPAEHPECNPIAHVEAFLAGEIPTNVMEVMPSEDLKELVAHAKKSDELTRLVYQVAGFVFNDACNAIDKGLDQTYRGLSVDHLFERISKSFDLPVPLDLTPKDIPEPGPLETGPVIQLLN